MGFLENFVNLIYSDISSVSFQILFNGSPSHSFNPERGLCQGDPLSPYLFILCADVFSGLIKEAAGNQTIHDIRVARRAPCISHLFFTDDNILFSRASPKECEKVLEILAKHQRVSGQMIATL
ncbi:unnamed protein product [Vicia faba]|uniref:Reverse transcriptase domain-containing protein n=1 Tax=Vicia faba TaxID=3906 RepID=A0AAV0YLA4_VICFA|nr:unnamed protein product [Vicia faba]